MNSNGASARADLRSNERRERMMFAIELMEDIVLDILEEARDLPHGLDVPTIAIRASVPAPYDTALVRFVLKQLEKTERAEQVGAGPKGAEWRIVGW